MYVCHVFSDPVSGLVWGYVETAQSSFPFRSLDGAVTLVTCKLNTHPPIFADWPAGQIKPRPSPSLTVVCKES